MSILLWEWAVHEKATPRAAQRVDPMPTTRFRSLSMTSPEHVEPRNAFFYR